MFQHHVARLSTQPYSNPPDVVTLKSQCCTTRCDNGELKPVITEQLSMNRLTHLRKPPGCFSSVQRLSLIYLVKEHLVAKTRDRCCTQHLSLNLFATSYCFELTNTLNRALGYLAPPQGGGGATRDRTADLLNANQALSQLSYSPITLCVSGRPGQI